MRVRAGLIAAALALIGLSSPSAQVATPGGWETVESSSVCGASRWPVAIGSPGPGQYALVVANAAPSVAGPQHVRVDGQPLLLVFRALPNGVGADLDSAALGLLSAGERLTADWPGSAPLDVPLAGIGPAIASLVTCGDKLAEARQAVAAQAQAEAAKAEAQKANRVNQGLRALGAGLAAFAEGAASVEPAAGGSSTSFGSRPMMMHCMKQSEVRSGLDRHCIYSCTGRERVMSVGSAELCPLMAEFPF